MSYKTVRFIDVFKDVVRATGRPVSTIDALGADELERFAQIIGEALLVFWETAFWPGTVVVEQRTIDSTDLYILKEAEGETRIGMIQEDECFFEEQPDPESLYGVLKRVEDQGDRIVCFDEDCPSEPWIRFQLPCPEFTRVDYSSDTTYSKGAVCFNADTGDCYRSKQDSNTGNAVTDTDWWEKQLFPGIARNYVKWACSAEWMSEDDGKYQQSARAIGELKRLEEKHISPRHVAR